MPNNNDDITLEQEPPEQQPDANEESQVVQPSTGGFGDLQLDQCEDKDFLTAAPFCPTCEIDENAVPDDWRDPEYDEEVFLDKSKCEYVAVIEVKLENILKNDQQERLDSKFKEIERKYIEEAISEYQGRNPDVLVTPEWFSEKPPPEALPIIEEAIRKATEEIQQIQTEGYYYDTKEGKPLGQFDSLLEWARDPDRIRLGIKSILDETDKLNNDRTVCAFGGCQYNIQEVLENKKLINEYIMGLNACMKSTNSALASPEYGEHGAVYDTLQALTTPVRMATFVVARGIGWFGDVLGNNSKNENERKLAKRFDGMLTGFFSGDIKNSLQRLQATYGTLNTYALEWQAYVPDDGIYLLPDTDVLRYTVRVPAFNVDMLPPAEEEDEDAADKFTEAEISLDNADWRVKYTEMKTGLTLMRYEYDVFRIRDNGSIIYDEEGATSFDMLEFEPIVESLKTFKVELEKLLNKNMMAMSYQKGNPFTWLQYLYHKTVNNVRIEIAKEEKNGKEILVIKDVYVTIESCPEMKLTTKSIVSINNEKKDKTVGSIKKGENDDDTVSQTESSTLYKKVKYLNKFKRRVCGGRADYSMLFLLSKMATALMGFQAEEKVKITDWAKEFIFPKVITNDGLAIGDNGNDKSTLGCILENFPLMSAESWSSILDDLVLGTWDVFRDELRKRMCKKDGKYIDPALERWANKAVEDAQEEVYEQAKQKYINQAKKEIDQKIQDAQQLDGLGMYLGETSNKGIEFSIDSPPKDILDDEKKLNEWREEQYEDVMRQVNKKARAAKKQFMKDLKDEGYEHPYTKDFKAAVRAQAPNYEESLTKKFVDFFTGNNPTKPDDDAEKFFEYLSDIGLCGMILGLKKALGCLFGQMDLQKIAEYVLRKTVGALRIDQFIYFITELLPVEQQVEVQKRIDKEISELFKGVVVPQSGDVLDPSLYEKIPESKPDPEFKSLLGVGHDLGVSGSSKISQFLTGKNNKKLEKLRSVYSDYPKNTKLKTPKEQERDDKKIAKLNKSIAKKQERKAKRDEIRKTKGYPKQGSIGKSSAKIIGIIFKAYIETIIDINKLNTTSLLDMIRKLPVVSSIPDFIFDFFTCPTKTIVEPPLKDIIKFNFKKPNFCDPTKPIVDFNFSKLKNPFKNPLKFLLQAFVAAIIKVITRILIKIVVQFLIEIEKMLCKMLGALGKGALNYATGNYDEGAFSEAFRDAFCGENASDEDVKKAMAGAIKTTGITSQSQASAVAQKIAGAFSGNFSKREMMLVIFKPEENSELMARVTKVITTSTPELSEFFDPPTKAAKFFGALANVLPQDHKDEIRDSLDSVPMPDAPIFDTICLTDAELDAWNNLRQQNLENRGLSPEDAANQVSVYNQRAEDTLVELLEAPDLESQIQQMLLPVGGIDPFGDPDPRRPPSGCEDAKDKSKLNSLLDEPEEITSMTGKGLDKIWNTVNLRFNSDLYGSNSGLLSRILSDTRGNSFWLHGFYRKFFITRNIIFDSEEQKEALKGGAAIFATMFEAGGYFPTTVGLHLFKQLQQDFEFKSLGMDEFGGKGKIEGTYNPFGLAPEKAFSYKVEKYEKAEAFMEYQVPVVIDGFGKPPEDKTAQGTYARWKQLVAYSSQVLLPEIKQNFDYKIRVDDTLNPFLITGDMRTGVNSRYNMEINQPMSDDVSSYLLEMDATNDQRYRKSALEFALSKILKEKFSDASITLTTDQYDKVITDSMKIFRDMCLDVTPRDGQPESVEVRVIDEDGKVTDQTETVTVPDGFLFGYTNIDFEEEELEYVGPEGEEYDYDEEEQVLGKMKKQNPRIHILDPKKHGGSYNRPPWYIEEPTFRGWLNIAKTISPDISGCKPSRESILQINKVKTHVKQARNKIKVNSKLFEGKGDCFYHIPFDRLVNKESLSMMEGCVKTVIRINVIEQLIGAIPVMGFIEYNENNFGSAFAQLVAKRIQQDLATTNVGLFPRKIEKQNYWLSFLEQATQMFWRMWESGDLDYENEEGEQELPEHLEDIFDEIRDLQEAYNWKDGMWRNPSFPQGVGYDGGMFGDMENRRIYLPSFYYDFDKKEFKDPNLEEEPEYDYSDPVPITYEEYMSAVANGEARYSLSEAEQNGGAYIVSPPIDDFSNEYGWLNPPPDAVFARIDKFQVGTKQVIRQKPIIRIDGPFEATQQEFSLGKDLEAQVGPEVGDHLTATLVRRASEDAAAEYGGISKIGPISPFSSDAEYVKYVQIIDGYEPEFPMQNPFDFQRQYAHYCALAYQSYGDAILYSDEKLEFGESITFGPLDSSWQFASCMWAVRSVQDKCMVVLTELINHELKDIMELFNKTWKPQVLDVNRYLLNTPLFIDNGLKNFGTRDHEERVAMGSLSEIGEVADVVIDASIESSFGNAESESPIKFKLEKYIRIVEKELEEGEQLPKPFEERDATLRGVVNVKHFQEFIDKNKEDYGEYYISDLFGDAEMLYSFRFERVFQILLDHLSESGDVDDATLEKAKEQVAKVEKETGDIETFRPTDDMNNQITGYYEKKTSFQSFFEGFSVVLTEAQFDAFMRGGLQQEEVDGRMKDIDYGEVKLPKDLISEQWFLAGMKIGPNERWKPVDIQGEIGLKYGVRIVANLPEGSGLPEASLDNLAKSKFAFEKCFYMNVHNDLENYEKNFSLPIAFAEVDLIDHKIKDFNWTVVGGESEYPMDIDCLLRKIIKTPEYEIIFKHVMNPSAVAGMCATLSGISFESAVGYSDGWEKVVSFEDLEGEEQDGAINMDNDDWSRKYFQDTRMLVRRVFSGFYLGNDFEDPEADTFDFSLILKAAVGSMFGWMKKGLAGVSAWWRTNMVSNPFDADGEECKTEYEKLLG